MDPSQQLVHSSPGIRSHAYEPHTQASARPAAPFSQSSAQRPGPHRRLGAALTHVPALAMFFVSSSLAPVPSARGAFCAACGAAVLWLIWKLLYSALPLMVSREHTTPGRRLCFLSPLVRCHSVFSWPIVSRSGGHATPASTISYKTGH